MKVYTGTYHDGEWWVSVEDTVAKRNWPLDKCLDIRNHSPTGFSWGYAGSGPAQLALAIMCDFYGKPSREEQLRALHPVHYQDFKFAFVARLDMHAGWRLTEEELRDVVAKIAAKKREP